MIKIRLLLMLLLLVGGFNAQSRFAPSPPRIVEEALRDLQPGEVYIDLGSGDGQFVAAAQAKGAIAHGVEIDHELVIKSRRYRGITVIEGDALEADISNADLVTFWMSGKLQTQLHEKCLREMKPGSRFIEPSRKGCKEYKVW